MVWLSLDRAELADLFREWPLHVREAATRTHLIVVEEVSFAGTAANAFSTFTVYRTDEKGRSELYCVGRYEDELSLEALVEAAAAAGEIGDAASRHPHPAAALGAPEGLCPVEALRRLFDEAEIGVFLYIECRFDEAEVVLRVDIGLQRFRSGLPLASW